MLAAHSYMYALRQQVPIHYIYVHIEARLFVHLCIHSDNKFQFATYMYILKHVYLCIRVYSFR